MWPETDMLYSVYCIRELFATVLFNAQFTIFVSGLRQDEQKPEVEAKMSQGEINLYPVYTVLVAKQGN